MVQEIVNRIGDRMDGAAADSPIVECGRRILVGLRGRGPAVEYVDVVRTAVAHVGDERGYCHETRELLIKEFCGLV